MSYRAPTNQQPGDPFFLGQRRRGSADVPRWNIFHANNMGGLPDGSSDDSDDDSQDDTLIGGEDDDIDVNLDDDDDLFASMSNDQQSSFGESANYQSSRFHRTSESEQIAEAMDELIIGNRNIQFNLIQKNLMKTPNYYSFVLAQQPLDVNRPSMINPGTWSVEH